MKTFTITCATCGELHTHTVKRNQKESTRKYCSSNCRYNSYYSNNKDKEKLRREGYANNNFERKILSRVKHRAKANNIPFNLEPNDIEVPTHCPVLGVLLERSKEGARGYHPNAVSLDKIDPAKGYIKGNVRVISARANLLKNDATLEELEAVLADFRRLND
mgnify:FL=1